MNKSQTRQSKPQLWDRILALLHEDLAERRNGKDLPALIEAEQEKAEEPREEREREEFVKEVRGTWINSPLLSSL